MNFDLRPSGAGIWIAGPFTPGESLHDRTVGVGDSVRLKSGHLCVNVSVAEVTGEQCAGTVQGFEHRSELKVDGLEVGGPVRFSLRQVFMCGKAG